MKTIIRLSVIGLILAALVGCYVAIDDGSGNLGIVLPDPRVSTDVANADFARVYILLGPDLVPVGDGTDYKEFDLESEGGEAQTSASVLVPAGADYQAILVLGNKQAGATGNQNFVPTNYAVSGLFSIGPGAEVILDLDLKTSPFVPVDPDVTLGRDLLGVVATNADVYVATSTQVFVDGGGTPSSIGSLDFALADDLRPGEQIVSISQSAISSGPAMMANTSLGVVPFVGTTATTDFDQNMPADVGLPILDSGGINIGGTESYGYLEFAGGITGYKTNGFAWMSPADLSEIVTGEALYDLAVSDEGSIFWGYFATKLGAFRFHKDVISLPPETTIDKIFEEHTNFFEVTVNGNQAVITQLALNRTDPDKIYLGTRRGAVVIDEDQLKDTFGETTTITNPPVIAGTENQEVLDIFVEGTGATALVAILTEHFLTVSSDGGTTFKSIPVYASSAAGTIADMLVSSGSPDVVLLAGSQGLAGVDIADIQ
ncbi:MAG: hypothetical protein ACOC8L_06555 [Spirochaetota bacterium]